MIMEMTEKRYTNGQVTIIWHPEVCFHAGECVRGCPEVFKPTERPWVKPENAKTEKIIEVIKKCPSGALTYEMNR